MCYIACVPSGKRVTRRGWRNSSDRAATRTTRRCGSLPKPSAKSSRTATKKNNLCKVSSTSEKVWKKQRDKEPCSENAHALYRRCLMATPTTVRRGVVHGKTIELDEETGLSDGQEVNVLVQPIEASE